MASIKQKRIDKTHKKNNDCKDCKRRNKPYELVNGQLPQFYYRLRWYSFGHKDDEGGLIYPKSNTGKIWLSGQSGHRLKNGEERETFTYIGFWKAKSEFEAIRMMRDADPSFIDDRQYDQYNSCERADEYFDDEGVYQPKGDRFL
jgi:hypothetical protein